MLALQTPRIDTSAIDRADLADTTKAKYRREIHKLYESGVNPAKRDELVRYAQSLCPSRRAFLKGAIRIMSADFELDLQSNATRQNLADVQVALLRLNAMRKSITVPRQKGTKSHTWLSLTQVTQITALCTGDDIQSKRDWIVMGVLLGAGLRRDELVSLTFDALKQAPIKNKIRDVLEVKGKGSKYRVIPIKPLLARRLREWREITGGGLIARSLGRKKELGDSLSAVSVFDIVRKYGRMIGIDELDPHDCRRSWAMIGLNAGIPITQISRLLGHSSIKTTQDYLDLELNLEDTISDYVPLSGD